LRVHVCVCVRARVRACVRACRCLGSLAVHHCVIRDDVMRTVRCHQHGVDRSLRWCASPFPLSRKTCLFYGYLLALVVCVVCIAICKSRFRRLCDAHATEVRGASHWKEPCLAWPVSTRRRIGDKHMDSDRVDGNLDEQMPAIRY
jgi:hypothetical protein